MKLIKSEQNPTISRQIDEESESLFGSRDGVVEPSFDFSTLLQAYENSSTISGIISKISTKTSTPFVKTGNEKLDGVLENLDIEAIALDMLIFGNAYFERLHDRREEKTLSFRHIIAPTIRVAKKKKGSKERSPFFYQRSQSGIKKVPFEQNEILLFCRNSIADPLYGDSIFYSSIDEIILLSFITKHFKKFFKNGAINPNILYDADGQMTDPQIEKLEQMIKDELAGIENSNTTIFLNGKIGKIDLATIFDPGKYIELKRELKEDIAIGLNIPFDLLSSINTNRANGQNASETLYRDVIIPLQNRILSQIKNQFLTWKENEKDNPYWENIADEDIKSIKFEDINLKDPYEQMKTLVGYQEKCNLSVNEVRSLASLGESVEGGDEYKVINARKEINESEEIKKIRNSISKMYAE